MMIRRVSAILLGAGFVMLAAAALIRDPVALDANIGAGILTLVGMPIGAFGLGVMLADVLYAMWREKRAQRRRSRES